MCLPKRKSIEKCLNQWRNQQKKSLPNKTSTEDTKITITKKKKSTGKLLFCLLKTESIEKCVNQRKNEQKKNFTKQKF